MMYAWGLLFPGRKLAGGEETRGRGWENGRPRAGFPRGPGGTVGLGRVCCWCLSFQLHLHTQWPLSIQLLI